MPRKNIPAFSSVIDLLLDVVCVVDAEGHFVFVSAASESIFGYTPEEMIGRRMIDMVMPEDRERTLQAARRVMAGDVHLHFENRYLRKDGKPVDIMWSARWSETDQVRVAVARDITARKRAGRMQAATYEISEAAHMAEDMVALFQRIHRIIGELLPSLNLVVALTDEAGGRLDFPYCVEAHQPGLAEPGLLVEVFCQEVIRCERTLLFSPDAAEEIPRDLRAALDGNSSSWLGAPLTSHKGTFGALVLVNHDEHAHYTEADKELLQYVSMQIASAIERKQLHARLQYMAQYDALTDLPNRMVLQDRLKTALARASREGRFLSLLYLDLDKFKEVNDTLGHAAGDRLLKEFACRLKNCVRRSDTVARMGGDEFVVLLESGQPPDGNLVVASKISQAFDEPFELDGHILYIRPSIGVAHYPEHGTDEHQLLRHADDAMYRMKNGRR